jgi:hypothetical protein
MPLAPKRITFMRAGLGTSRYRARVRNWIAPALLIAALFGPVFDPGVQLYYRDTGRFQYPMKHFTSERLHQGQLPLWNPWSEAGESLTAQLDAGLWHPTTLLHAVLPLDFAFKLQHLSALLLALWGMYALARRLGASREASAAAAVAFCGSGFLVSMVASNLLFALGLAAMPLALERLLAFLEEPRPLTLLCGAAALASCTWAGDVQSMLFGGYFGLAGSLIWGARRKQARRAVALTALWGTCALLLTLPAVLPVLPRFSHSARAAGEPGLLEDFALRPARLAGVALPWAFDDTVEEGEHSTYAEYLKGIEPDAFADCLTVGVPILLLAFASGKRGRWMVAGAVVLLAAACGGALWIGRPFYALLPGMQLFRYPEKLVGPATLLLCAAAAFGVDEASREPKRFARVALVAAGVLAVVALAAPALIPAGATHDAFAGKLRAAAAVQALFSALLAMAVRRPVWIAPICALSAWLATHSLLSTAPLEVLHGPFRLAAHLESQAGPSEGRWRVLTEGDQLFPMPGIDPRVAMTYGGTRALLPNYNLLARIEGVASYSALRDLDYERAWYAAPRAMAALFNVAFVLRTPQDPPPPHYARGPHGILVRRFPEEPRAFLLPCAQTEPDATALANAMGHPGFDPHRKAFVRERVPLPETCASAAVAVAVARPRPEEIQLEPNAATPSLLIVGEHYEKGWHALVDGVEAEVVQVDLAAQGVVVPAGAHRVELRFSPPHVVLGLAIALGCAAALLVLDARRKRI